MTRKKAIKQIQNIIQLLQKYMHDDEKEALNMAIKELEKEPCEDAISREDAREAFNKWFFDSKDLRTVDEVVDELPSVTPSINNKVHLCDSCKYTYPECPCKTDDVIFGNGKGNDNICACSKYEPSRRKGHWIPIPYELDYGSDVKCSVCGKEIIAGEDFKICPYCFADMRGNSDADSN